MTDDLGEENSAWKFERGKVLDLPVGIAFGFAQPPSAIERCPLTQYLRGVATRVPPSAAFPLTCRLRGRPEPETLLMRTLGVRQAIVERMFGREESA